MTVQFPCRTIAACVAVLLLAVACGGRSGQSRRDQVSISQRGPGMKRADLGTLQLPVPRTFDLSHVEPEHFAAALGNDPVRIFEYVRDQIAYEAYPGLLRDARGTLIARAGNSIDRAVLLATLLKFAGNRVRFARGTLPEKEARELVTSMFVWSHGGPASGKPQDTLGTLQEASGTFAASIKRDYALLKSVLKGPSGTSPSDTASLDSLISGAQVHFWVQLAKDGGWVDLDPLFADAAFGRTHVQADEVMEAIPEPQFHRVIVRVKLEEYTGDTPSTRYTLAYETKAADLSARDLLFIHLPEKWQGPVGSIDEAMAAAIEDTGRVKPVLSIGEQVVMGEPFLPRLKTTGLGGIGTLLRGEGSRTAVPLASAQWLEFEFIAPGGERQMVTREIFDIVGKARRAAGQHMSGEEVRTRVEAPGAFDVSGVVYNLFFTNGNLDPHHLSDVLADAPAEGEPVDIAVVLRRISLTFAATLDGLLGGMARPQGGVIRFYPDSPRVFIAEFSLGEPFRVVLDLRRHQVRAVASQPDEQTLNSARILRGVVEGTLERTLMEYLVAEAHKVEPSPVSAMSTSLVFERAAAEKSQIIVLPGDAARLANVPPDVLARVQEDTATGLLAVAPERPIHLNGISRFAWWRVHPVSGETTAVTDEGLHATASEVTLVRQKDGRYVQVNVVRSHGPWGGLNQLPAPRSYLTVTHRRGSREFHEFLRWLLSEGPVAIRTIVP